MLSIALPLAIALPIAVQAAPAAAPLPSDPVAADWKAIPDDEVMLITLAGNRTVAIRLAARYTPDHAANIRKLIAARWWDGESVYRVQENWVAQWGDPTEKKPLPTGVAAAVTPEFEIAQFAPAVRMAKADSYSAMSGISADGWPMASDK